MEFAAEIIDEKIFDEKSQIERNIHSELEKSWNLQQKFLTRKYFLTKNFNCNDLTEIRSTVSTILLLVEHYLLDVLNYVSLSTDEYWHAPSLAFKRLVNEMPTATTSDLAGLACFPERIQKFNPLLSDASVSNVRREVITKLELCVLDDKIDALVVLQESASDSKTKSQHIIRELVNSRCYDVTNFFIGLFLK